MLPPIFPPPPPYGGGGRWRGGRGGVLEKVGAEGVDAEFRQRQQPAVGPAAVGVVVVLLGWMVRLALGAEASLRRRGVVCVV